MSIVVAVRVRPFNQREKDLRSKLCVKMNNNTTILYNTTGKERSFTFDHSFWSHNAYNEEEDGYLRPKGKRYADQAVVYEKVGKQVLNNALGGFHCCLFAYGQTGSGKSYSMIGYGANRGIVPIISQEVFNVAKEQKSDSKSFHIKFTMLEIYNEKVQDLMLNINKRNKAGLKIRESKKHGVFVQGLSKHVVKSYTEIESKMMEGNENRTIASTQMNKNSSRAHTIISIELTQKEIIYGNVTEKFSVINLVDLAGSEKVSKTGATGDRLKEGSSINKSLTVLGMVITALADISMGKKNKVVPYRTSALTRILQNALGGNSKTLMICAISPASDNYDETLSTLRYADQAKKIKCHAKINESPKDKMIRELKDENQRLKKQLGIKGGGEEDKISDEQMKEFEMVRNKNKTFAMEIEGLKSALEEAQRRAAEMKEVGQVEKLSEDDDQAGSEEPGLKRKNTLMTRNMDHAHLININEDPFLSGKIFHDIDDLIKIVIGRRPKDKKHPRPNITLASVKIEQDHAFIEKTPEGYFLYLNEGKTGGVNHNGKEVVGRTQLRHLDRIIFGTAAIFLFKDVKTQFDVEDEELKEEEIDYEYCQMELYQKGIGDTRLTILPEEREPHVRDEEIRRQVEIEKEKELREQTEKVIHEYEEKIKGLEDETHILKEKDVEIERRKDLEKQSMILKYEAIISQLENAMPRNNELLDQELRRRAQRENLKKMKENEGRAVQRKVATLNPNLIELNLIAKEMGRHFEFSPHLTYFYCDEEDAANPEQYARQKKKRIKIRVDNRELGYAYFWDLGTFTNRYFLIKEMYTTFEETDGPVIRPSQSEDPFYDPPGKATAATGYFKLITLAYLVDYNEDVDLMSPLGPAGYVDISVAPLDDEGQPISEENEVVHEMDDDPMVLVGRDLSFKIDIGQCNLETEDFIRPHVCYKLWLRDQSSGRFRFHTFNTQDADSNLNHIDFGYSKVHTCRNVTKEFIDYMLGSKLCFKLKTVLEIEKVEIPTIAPKQIDFTKHRFNPIPQSGNQRSGGLPRIKLGTPGTANGKEIPASPKMSVANKDIKRHNQMLISRKKFGKMNSGSESVKVKTSVAGKRGSRTAGSRGKNQKDCRIF